jgi:hypothetical protein
LRTEKAIQMSSHVEHQLPTLADLCRRHHVRRLEVFGSAARDAELRPESDLDFLVEFEAQPPGGYAMRTSAFSRRSRGFSSGRSISSSTPPWGTRSSGSPSIRRGAWSMRLEAKNYLYDLQEAADLICRGSVELGEAVAEGRETGFFDDRQRRALGTSSMVDKALAAVAQGAADAQQRLPLEATRLR